MGLFRDDFERANGPLEAPWQTAGNNGTINGGYASCAASAYVSVSTISDSNRLSAESHNIGVSTSGTSGGPAVKMSAANNWCYYAGVHYSNPNYIFTIRRWQNNATTTLASEVLGTTLPAWCDIYIEWEEGTLRATLNGEHTLTVDDGALAEQLYAGMAMYGAGAKFADISITGGSAVQFAASPDVIPNYGGACSTVTFTGTGTDWLTSTPTFTVNHGTLSDIVIDSDTAAHATYCPGAWLGPATFTDPSTGLTDVSIVSSDPVVVPPTGAALTESIVAYLQRSADAEVDSTIINRNESFNAYGVNKTVSETITTVHQTLVDPDHGAASQDGILRLLIQVYLLLNGGLDWGGVATVFGNTSLIKANVDEVLTKLDEMAGDGGISLETLAAALSDLRGVGQYNLTDLYNHIGDADLTPVLDAIAALRGDDTSTVKAIQDSLAAMRTGEGHTLQDVLDAINTGATGTGVVDVAGLLLVIAAIALAIPTGGATLAVPVVAAGGGAMGVLATLFEVAQMIGTLAGIVADIAEIKEALDGLSPSAASACGPLWPGIDGATVSDPIAISDGLTIDGPFDGLIFAISGHPSGASYYGFGERKSWRYVGSVMFITDRGDSERAESIGIESQLVVPRTMLHAGSAILRLNGGWTGTVRTWTVNT